MSFHSHWYSTSVYQYLSEDSCAHVWAFLAWRDCKIFNSYIFDWSPRPHPNTKYKSTRTIWKWLFVKHLSWAPYHFTKGIFPFLSLFPPSFFFWNAVLKEVVSAFASICSQQDSIKHYAELRWPNSGCDILLSYFTKHRVLSLNRSLVALHEKTIPSLCGPASLQTVGTIEALSGVCTALCAV